MFLDNSILNLPVVSFTQEGYISVDPTAETFTGPGGAIYRITYRGSNSGSGAQRFRIEYEPNDPASPRITAAMIQSGADSVHMIRAGGKFGASNKFIFGRLIFPIEAQELMKRYDVQLVIAQYSEMVQDSIAIPVGLVSEDTDSNGAPHEPGSEDFDSESPSGPVGGTGN